MSTMPLKDLNSDRFPNGFINVINDYPWTVYPVKTPDIPFISMVEYEQDIANIFANALYWSRGLINAFANNDQLGPYEGLYTAEATGTTFVFPYYESYNFAARPNWTETKGIENFETAAQLIRLAGIVSKASTIFGSGAPGININKPRVWTGTESAEYSIAFYLFNTVDPTNNIKNNIKLINRLKMSTLHDQIDIMRASPPALFEISIPNIRYSPAAIISNLEIINEGQINYYSEYGNVPDAFLIRITIKELITESRQILDAAITGDTKIVSAIKSASEQNEEFNKAKAQIEGSNSSEPSN